MKTNTILNCSGMRWIFGSEIEGMYCSPSGYCGLIDRCSLDELRELFVKTGLSRILIYRDSIDNVIGYVHSSALFHHRTVEEAVSKNYCCSRNYVGLEVVESFHEGTEKRGGRG